jgi:hypothetical protein
VKEYGVHHIKRHLELDGDWHKPVWRSVPELLLDCYMGPEPAHRPETRAKVLYDAENIYVIFRVKDRYVKAVSENPQDQVCRDSCVEFFFTAGEDTSGYFNFEINCCGVYLFHYQKARHVDMVLADDEDCKRIKIAHTLSGPIPNEIPNQIDWTVEFAIPLDILKRYCPDYSPPRAGAVWTANFYKCADNTSHPHWLTWAPVDYPYPDFHRPDSFGVIEFV